MKKLLLISLAFCSVFAFAQKKDSIPKKDQRSVELLVPHLIKDSHSEREKVESIYEWITRTIDYDYSKVDSDKPLSNVKVDKILSTKKAICGEYCDLMQAMLREVKIESEVVGGYTHTALPDSMIVPIADTHAWIAIKIGGKWFLADPTWDAGYLGNIKTDKEERFAKKNKKLESKFTKRLNKLNAKLEQEEKEKSQKKIKNKIETNLKKKEEKKKALQKKEDKAKEFTGKIGFVKDPKKDWFLIPADSFLLKHLPLNPMWQLKKDTVSIVEFAQGKDSLMNRLNKSIHSSFNYSSKIEAYNKLDFLEKMILDAEIGIAFNNKNCQVKAVNYYNYLKILTDKKTQKLAPPKYKIYNYSTLLHMVDTSKTYSKLAKKESKNNYSYFKKAYKKIYKGDQKVERDYERMQTKLASTHEKSIEKIEGRNEKLEAQNEIIKSKIVKLRRNTSKASYKNDAEAVKYLTDSLDMLVRNFKNEKLKWKQATDSTFLQPLIDTLLHNRYLFRIRNIYVESQNLDFNNDISKIDSLIHENNKALTSLYLDSLQVEMLSKELYNRVKGMSRFMSYSKTELVNLELKEHQIDADVIQGNFNQILLDHYVRLAELNLNAMAHNKWMAITLESFEVYLNDMDRFISGQENAHKERYEYYMKMNENNFNRDENVYKLIEKDCKKWKVEFKKSSK